MYECITGRAAFSGASVLEIGAQVIHVNPELPSKVNERVPEELDRVVMKALAKKVGERYQSAKEMKGELRRVHEELSDEDKHRTLRLPARAGTTPAPLASQREPLYRAGGTGRVGHRLLVEAGAAQAQAGSAAHV